MYNCTRKHDEISSIGYNAAGSEKAILNGDGLGTKPFTVSENALLIMVITCRFESVTSTHV